MMRVDPALYFLGLSLLGQGCAPFGDLTHQMSASAKKSMDDWFECARNRHWADAAWNEACNADPQHTYSDDYASGFTDGFAEYLSTGGCQPPQVAPPRYQRLSHQKPEDFQAIQDWFAGYLHGVSSAQRSGYRQWTTRTSAVREPIDFDRHANVAVNPPVSGPAVEKAFLQSEQAVPAPTDKEVRQQVLTQVAPKSVAQAEEGAAPGATGPAVRPPAKGLTIRVRLEPAPWLRDMIQKWRWREVTGSESPSTTEPVGR